MNIDWDGPKGEAFRADWKRPLAVIQREAKDRERYCLGLRRQGMTYRCIGEIFDINPERARQIVGKAERRERLGKL